MAPDVSTLPSSIERATSGPARIRASRRGASCAAPRRRVSEAALIVSASVFSAVCFNWTFFGHVFGVYPIGTDYLLFHASLFLVLVSILVVALACLGSEWTTKPLIIALQLGSALSSYFMDAYGTMVDEDMLRNALQTDVPEARDLASVSMLVHVVVLGVIPSWIVARMPIRYARSWRGFARRGLLALLGVLVIALSLFGSAPTFASFFREQKAMRYFCNPATYVCAAIRVVQGEQADADGPVRAIAEDAHRPGERAARRLVVFVVGETARPDRFSLNGYARETNPLLNREDVISFPDVRASGTSTATALPLMFSPFTRTDGGVGAARQSENVLDVLARVGVSVLWRDNNSSSKGVADRVAYENFKAGSRNPIRDGEPRDEGMLTDLQSYVDSCTGDIFVVLHQMGSHGPAYSKRYPERFNVFTPACESNLLETCERAQIDNAYDNTILYTDYFLARVIEFLRQNEPSFETAMLYFGDHGESLGEHGMYLHGYPYALAPKEQTQVPAIFWFGDGWSVDRDALRAGARAPFSHDFIFHTVLGLFDVGTRVYRDDLDMLAR